jgi:hypothetical protein
MIIHYYKFQKMSAIWEINQQKISQRKINIHDGLTNIELVQLFISLEHEISIFKRLDSGEDLHIISDDKLMKDNEQTYLEIADNAKYSYEKYIKILKLHKYRVNRNEWTTNEFISMLETEMPSFLSWEYGYCQKFIEDNKLNET